MAIEIDGVVYRTEAQWERRHRHVNKRCKGVERTWRSPRGGKDSAVFFSEAQTRPWTEAEKKRDRKAKAAAKHAREVEQARKEGYEEGYGKGYSQGGWDAIEDAKRIYSGLAGAMVRMNDPSMIVIDTETTGLYPYCDEVLQLAITDREGNELWNSFYKPEHTESWPEAQEINGISPEDVAGCPHISDDVEQIQAIIDAAGSICIYNADFDRGFLRAAGISLEGHRVYDTMVDFAEHYGEYDGYHPDPRWQTLATAADYTGYEGAGDAHDALEDCRMTAHVQRWCDEQRLAAVMG